VIGPQLGGESEIGRQERGAKLCDGFLAGVTFIAVALAPEVTIKP
jgi:hypothetical protein